MATKIQRIARDLAASASEYPSEARYEVLDELIAVAAREEGLSSAEIDELIELVGA